MTPIAPTRHPTHIDSRRTRDQQPTERGSRAARRRHAARLRRSRAGRCTCAAPRRSSSRSRELIEDTGAAGGFVVYTQDWHPDGDAALRRARRPLAGALRDRLGRRRPAARHPGATGRWCARDPVRRTATAGSPCCTCRPGTNRETELSALLDENGIMADHRRRPGRRLVREVHRDRRGPARLPGDRAAGADPVRRAEPGRHRGRRSRDAGGRRHVVD